MRAYYWVRHSIRTKWFAWLLWLFSVSCFFLMVYTLIRGGYATNTAFGAVLWGINIAINSDTIWNDGKIVGGGVSMFARWLKKSARPLATVLAWLGNTLIPKPIRRKILTKKYYKSHITSKQWRNTRRG